MRLLSLLRELLLETVLISILALNGCIMSPLDSGSSRALSLLASNVLLFCGDLVKLVLLLSSLADGPCVLGHLHSYFLDLVWELRPHKLLGQHACRVAVKDSVLNEGNIRLLSVSIHL